ncbi:MAG: nitrate reductase subunit beta [Planctomycetota bacterium]|nr:MAG: nitrate reductase subunit beta [Planctomycetota bacterium]
MDVRSQVSMVFHLDKCIGCHTCSIACKNIWTDREGTEYMWWNNVETKPGAGYPTRWEDQVNYKGGWEVHNGKLRLKSTGPGRVVFNMFHNPSMPSMEDYYEPWTYRFQDLFNGPEAEDQPTAMPVSMITGEYLDIESGPNWDDDLGGSPVYAENDVNLEGLPAHVRQQMFEIQRLAFFYIPRICNHCLNPACVASCPSGALYKRGEDGIVLVNQKRCRAWRSCISACPYKKVYFNWSTGKSEKCILCYPRVETGQAPACFHSCVGRIRYLGNLLYDAEKIPDVAKLDEYDLVDGFRNLILDPNDPEVEAAALENGIPSSVVESAKESPVYRFVKQWKIALPLHAEFRTLPMLFYVPPLSPVISSSNDQAVRVESDQLFSDVERARIPMEFLSKLFAAGNTGKVRYALRKQYAVRLLRRHLTVGDVPESLAKRALAEADCSVEEADQIYRLTSLANFDQRFIIPPSQREQAIEAMRDPMKHKQESGFGFREAPFRV